LAVLRFHRDKRGYEYFSLIEPGGRRGRSGRLLYWFRTPPGVKLGRVPFDAPVQRELESRYPGVRFDWPRILATPIPSAEDEMWRERRRVAKAARLAAGEPGDEPPDEALDAAPTHAREAPGGSETMPAGEPGEDDGPAAGTAEASNQETSASDATARRRRRRRRGKGRQDPTSGL
jgi:hypothetical protein